MTTRIVFLDASTVDYGDMDMSPLSQIGWYHDYPVSSHEETITRLRDAEVAIANKTLIDRAVLERCPNLKFIAVAATGYNNIDTHTARQRGIAVANVPGYSTTSVAQLTMTFLLALSTNLISYAEAARNGSWSLSPIYTLGTWPTFDLKDRTLGILGLGAIGREVARLASAFGMKVVALKRDGVSYSDEIPRLGLHSLAECADFVSLHMPLTAENRHIINRDFFNHMKREGFLINMARGPLVNPEDLCEALHAGTIKGAALDVMDKEPPDADDPLLSAPRLILTPHIAWASLESRKRLVREIADNISSFLQGKERNIVN